MIFRIKIFGIFRFPNKKNFEFFFINSSSIFKKIKFFFSKCRQKFQKSYIFCTWFGQFSSSESFKKQVSTPAIICKTDCTRFFGFCFFIPNEPCSNQLVRLQSHHHPSIPKFQRYQIQLKHDHRM